MADKDEVVADYKILLPLVYLVILNAYLKPTVFNRLSLYINNSSSLSVMNPVNRIIVEQTWSAQSVCYLLLDLSLQLYCVL